MRMIIKLTDSIIQRFLSLPWIHAHRIEWVSRNRIVCPCRSATRNRPNKLPFFVSSLMHTHRCHPISWLRLHHAELEAALMRWRTERRTVANRADLAWIMAHIDVFLSLVFQSLVQLFTFKRENEFFETRDKIYRVHAENQTCAVCADVRLSIIYTIGWSVDVEWILLGCSFRLDWRWKMRSYCSKAMKRAIAWA